MSRDIRELETKARALRRDVLNMIWSAQSGHLGGSMSEMDILVALFHDEMHFDGSNVSDPNRDRFVLSKGHTAPALYVNLADVGCFPRERLFDSYRRVNGLLQGHPCMKTPGIEIAGGSLGIGLSCADGMAIGNRHQGYSGRVYCMVGDGELDEGEIWEAAATAANFKVDNLCVFVDINGLQNDAATKDVKDMGDIRAKWEAFGWHVQEIDGHDFNQIFQALDRARAYKGSPSVILAHTVKGKGVSFMENEVEWHGKTPDREEYEKALAELSKEDGL